MKKTLTVAVLCGLLLASTAAAATRPERESRGGSTPDPVVNTGGSIVITIPNISHNGGNGNINSNANTSTNTGGNSGGSVTTGNQSSTVTVVNINNNNTGGQTQPPPQPAPTPAPQDDCGDRGCRPAR